MKTAAMIAAALLLAHGQTYRGRADAVAVDVLALDGNRPIGGLGADDFTLLDNGVPQRIDSITLQEVPFSMLLVLDTSGSVRGNPLRDLQEAARGAVAALRPEDRGALITFSDGLQGRPGWTPEQPVLAAAIDRTGPGGMTSLYDATFAALLHVDPEPNRRRLIVLFTDGNDTASWLPGPAVLQAASRTDAVVYAITTSLPSERRVEAQLLMHRSGVRLTPNAPVVDSTPFLEDLTGRTGGDLIIESSSNRLRQIFEHIITEFRSRYVLSYMPANVAATGWHGINVELVGRRGSVKARRGYER
jgi:VWFA-related protein